MPNLDLRDRALFILQSFVNENRRTPRTGLRLETPERSRFAVVNVGVKPLRRVFPAPPHIVYPTPKSPTCCLACVHTGAYGSNESISFIWESLDGNRNEIVSFAGKLSKPRSRQFTE